MRCLIVGVDGSFGGALSQSLVRRGHDVVATTRRPGGSYGHLFLDLAAPLPALPQVDVAVICAAMARLEDCRRYPELAHRVNVAAPLELSAALTQTGARVILLSSSAVFGCLAPFADESTPPMPRSAYGRLKAEAEARLLALGPLVSVLRLTKVVKPNAGLLSDWISQVGAGRTVRSFDDCRFCPLTVAQAVEAITALVERRDGGVFHISGARDLTFAEAATFLACRIGAPAERVEPMHGLDSDVPWEDLTPFTSLATGRLSALTGFVPPEPFAVLEQVYGPEIDAARAVLAAHSAPPL